MTQPDPLLNQLVGGRYRLLERLGKGGMGSVYKAKQLSMDRLVAVKLIHPSLAGNPAIAARFHREMQATARVEHPNTVQVFDYGQAQDGQLFLVMELLQGATLAQLLEVEAWLPAGRLIPIAAQIVRALGAAHAKGIVHRDLKPENVMLVERFGERDFVKVLDFGIAHFLAGEASAARMTADGSLIGTPAYMSPEQARGEPVGPKSDLYSLGVLLYQAALGQPPFEGSTLPEILLRQQTQAPRPPSEIAPGRLPAALETLILWLLEKDPAGRPPDAEAVLAHLAGAPAAAIAEAEPSLGHTSIRLGGTPPPGSGSVPWAPATSAPGAGEVPRHTLREGAPPPPPGQRATRPQRPGAAGTPANLLEPIALAQQAPAPEPDRSASPPPPLGAAPAARRPRSRWRILVRVALVVLALGAGAAALVLIFWNRPEDAVARIRLEQYLVSDGDPPAPEICRAKRPAAVQLLLRPAMLLEGAAIDSNRPGDFEALKLLEDGASGLKGEAEYWSLRGRAHLAAGSAPEQARQAADTAVQLCSGYALAHKLAGNALQKAGLHREARAAYTRALEIDPAYLAPTANLGLIALKEEDTAAALAAFDQVLARRPGDFEILLARSEARRLAGHPFLAIADLGAAAKANPRSAEAPLRLGQLLETLGRRQEARQAFCKARALGSAEAIRACP